MTTFIALPDIHSAVRRVQQIEAQLAAVDVVLLVGDMTNGLQRDLERLLDAITPHNTRIFAVCGNMDTQAMDDDLAARGMSIHRTHALVDGLALVGLGGALPFYGDYVFSEEQLAQFLDEASAGIPATMPLVLVAHQPPYNTQVDIANGKPVGSRAVRAFIEQKQPLVCFTGHIHQSTGLDTLGTTRLINPGPIARTGDYAYCEIIDGQVTTLERRSLTG